MVKIYSACLTLFCLIPHLALSATFDATVDRNELAPNEQLVLTLSLINSDVRLRAEGVNPNIDLSVLNSSFEVDIPKVNFRYNIYRGKGRSSSELKVKLTPKKNGSLRIPSFQLDGQQTTPITVNVLNTSTHENPEVFVRSGSNSNSLWRGQQLIVYLDIFHRVALENTSQKNTLETEPVQIELIPHWKLPQDTRSAQHNETSYNVQRIAWALFPDTVGKFRVHLPSIEIHTTLGVEKHFPSQSLSVDINALPEGIPENIIIGKPNVTQTPLPETVKQHQLQTWSLTIDAPIAVSSLPNYLPYDTAIEQINFYPDRVRRNNIKTSSGIIDQGEYTFSIMPQGTGKFVIPAIQIPYFDPASGMAKLIELKPQGIRVTPGLADNNTHQLKAHLDKTLLIEKTTNTIKEINWKNTSIAFALLWLSTLIILLRIYKRNKPEKAQEPVPAASIIEAGNINQLQQELLKALNAKTLEDSLDQCKKHFPEKQEMLATIKKFQRSIYDKQDVQKNYSEDIRTLISLIKNKASQ